MKWWDQLQQLLWFLDALRVCAFALMCSAAYVLAHSFGAALGCVVAKEGTFVVERCRYEAWSGAAVRQR